MDFKLLQISSMHKPQKADYKEISNECVLLGERAGDGIPSVQRRH